MVDVARLSLQIDVTGAKRAKQALDGMRDGSIKVTSATDKLAGVYARLDKLIDLTAKSQGQYAAVLSKISGGMNENASALQSMSAGMASASAQTESLARESESLTPTLTRQATLFEQLNASTIRLTATTGEYSRSYQQLRASVDPAYRASLEYKRAVEILDAELARGTITLAQYNRTLQMTRVASQQVAQFGFRPMQGAIQQAGYQIGDFAVQVGSGQSALVAFTQQGAQMAGIFGPGGAVLGAVLAIGGAIAGYFVRSMGLGGESIEEVTDRTMELVKALGEATDRQREFINTQFAQRMAEQEKAIQASREEIHKANREMETFTRRLSDEEAEVLKANGTLDKWTDTINDSRLAINNAESSIKSITKEQKEFWKGVREGGDDADETKDKVQELVDTFKDQAETLNLNARETALYKLQRLEANGADREAVKAARQQINASFDIIDAHKKRADALNAIKRQQQALNDVESQLGPSMGAEDRGQGIIDGLRQEAEAVRMGLDQEFAIRMAHKERVMALDDGLRMGVIENAEERNRLEVESLRQRNEQLRQIEMQKYDILGSGQEAFLSATENLFGNLASIAEKGGKDQFSTWKAMASAQAAVSTALAVANALTAAPPPVNFALAASVGALGAVQIAQIQSQEYQGSYLGGGYTGQGSRSGGVDGKGGFPAILHPNETVIDHEMGQRNRGGSNSQETNITQVLQVPGNIQQEVKQQIMAALPLIRSTAINAVSTEISRGGNMARQVGRRS